MNINYIYNYLLTSIKYGYNYIIDVIINYFYHKNIKDYTSNYKNTKLLTDIKQNRIEFIITKLNIDKIHYNFIKNIFIRNIKLIFYPNKNNLPLILFLINNLDFNINDDLTIIDFNSNNNVIVSSIDKIININKYIISGCDKLSRILEFISNRQKYIFKNVKINFLNIKIVSNEIILSKLNNIFKCNIKEIKIINTKYNAVLCKIKNIYAHYEDNEIINVNIDCISINVNDKKDKPMEILDKIKNITINSDEDSNLEIKFIIKKININYRVNNNYKLRFLNVNVVPFRYIQFSKLIFISFKKDILDLEGFLYNIKDNEYFIRNIDFKVYDSFCHKLYLSFDKYITKKKIIKKKPCKPIFDVLDDNLLNSYIDKHNISDNPNPKINDIDNNGYNLSIPNDLTSSFIINKNCPIKNIFDNYIDANSTNLLKISIDSFKIYFMDKNNYTAKWILNNFSYNIKYNEVTIYTNNWLITDKNDKNVLNKYSKNDRIIYINYKNNKTEVTINSLYLNIIPEVFIKIYDSISNNIKYINKMFYNNFDSDYIINDFFIKCITINSFNVYVDYYPKNCNYYKIFVGKLNEAYKLLNYQNINLKSKEILIHYPYNFSMMFKKIFSDWLYDIKKYQIKNIINGTKLGIAIDNIPVNYTKELVTIIEKGLNSICLYFKN